MKFSYTCSLGHFCHSSTILKQNKLKLCSYPFDWMQSSYNNVIHCIKDDFNIFLDKSYYRTITNKQCEHSYYNMMFTQRNPLMYQNDYTYYIRCVDRFKNLLQNKGTKLFITINANNDSIDENIMHNMIEFNNTFGLYTDNYVLLIIYHIKNKKQNYHKITIKGNIHFLELHTTSISNGVSFTNFSDNAYLYNVIETMYK
jgi:hypothetical protein